MENVLNFNLNLNEDLTMTNKFWIEEDNYFITLYIYINDEISKRINKAECTVEKRLDIVMTWLNEMNHYSTFIYGKHVKEMELHMKVFEEYL